MNKVRRKPPNRPLLDRQDLRGQRGRLHRWDRRDPLVQCFKGKVGLIVSEFVVNVNLAFFAIAYNTLCFTFYFHQAHNCRTLVFVKFVANVLDGFLELGYHNVFEGVDAALVALYLVCKKAQSLFRFGKF